jgi:hypothetical protein
VERARLARGLEALPGQHLVFVRYGPHHPNGAQWVFNRADLPTAKVVWARSLGPRDKGEELSRRDRELITRLPGRTLWVLDETDQPPGVREVVVTQPEPSDRVKVGPPLPRAVHDLSDILHRRRK